MAKKVFKLGDRRLCRLVRALEYISLHNITYATHYATYLLFIYYQLDTKDCGLLISSETTNCAIVDIAVYRLGSLIGQKGLDLRFLSAQSQKFI